eukprot:scaffold3697_cov55-Phaeocystis_antarctica.AAC.13
MGWDWDGSHAPPVELTGGDASSCTSIGTCSAPPLAKERGGGALAMERSILFSPQWSKRNRKETRGGLALIPVNSPARAISHLLSLSGCDSVKVAVADRNF